MPYSFFKKQSVKGGELLSISSALAAALYQFGKTALELLLITDSNCNVLIRQLSACCFAAKVFSTFTLWLKANQTQVNTALKWSFFMHWLGDIAIELPFEQSILVAIGFFALGHGANISQLITTIEKDQPASFYIKRLVPVALALGYLAQATLAEVNDQTLSVAIGSYSALLASLLLCSMLQQQNSLPLSAASLFYISSDLLIAHTDLIKSMPITPWGQLTFPLYYAAQLLFLAYANEAPVLQEGNSDLFVKIK